jgi:hypothetical protein
VSVLTGTVIVALRTSLLIYVGVDSKVISVGAHIVPAAEQPKTHSFDGVLFAHAGIFKDLNGQLDVIGVARASISAGGDLNEIAERFTAAVKPQLRVVLKQLKAQNRAFFDEKLRQPLSMLFASARDGTPRIAIVTFTVLEGTVEVVDTVIRCPGECDPNILTAVSLGEHEVADRFLDSYDSELLSANPPFAIRSAIEAQAKATPNWVALPAKVFLVQAAGIHEVP